MSTPSVPDFELRRLVCIVEGHGDVKALPCLCHRVLRHLGATSWYVDEDPVRQPRSKLVDQSVKCPSKPPTTDGLGHALRLALARRPDAVLVVCDADDDCPVAWGPAVDAQLKPLVRGHGVMIVREYESWLLLGCDFDSGRGSESIRDAKGALRKLRPGYMPTIHQDKLTRELNIDRLWELSDSFDKFVRSLACIAELPLPRRPGRSSPPARYRRPRSR